MLRENYIEQFCKSSVKINVVLHNQYFNINPDNPVEIVATAENKEAETRNYIASLQEMQMQAIDNKL